MGFCTKCGKQMAEGGQFCGECGARQFTDQDSHDAASQSATQRALSGALANITARMNARWLAGLAVAVVILGLLALWRNFSGPPYLYLAAQWLPKHFNDRRVIQRVTPSGAADLILAHTLGIPVAVPPEGSFQPLCDTSSGFPLFAREMATQLWLGTGILPLTGGQCRLATEMVTLFLKNGYIQPVGGSKAAGNVMSRHFWLTKNGERLLSVKTTNVLMMKVSLLSFKLATVKPLSVLKVDRSGVSADGIEKREVEIRVGLQPTTLGNILLAQEPAPQARQDRAAFKKTLTARLVFAKANGKWSVDHLAGFTQIAQNGAQPVPPPAGAVKVPNAEPTLLPTTAATPAPAPTPPPPPALAQADCSVPDSSYWPIRNVSYAISSVEPQLAYLYYALTGGPTHNAYLLLASMLSPQYATAQDEFTRHDLLSRLKPQITQKVKEYDARRYFTFDADVTIRQYDFRSHSFPISGISGVFQFGAYGYPGVNQKTRSFSLKITNGKVFKRYAVSDETQARKLDSLIVKDWNKSAKLYLFAQGMDANLSDTMDVQVVKARFIGADAAGHSRDLWTISACGAK